MKSKFYNIIFTFLIISSCNTENVMEEDILEFELAESVALKSSTTMVSSIFFNLGVTAINVKKIGSKIEYEFVSDKEFGMNKESINMSDFTVVYQNNTLSTKENPEIKVTLYDNQPYIISPKHKGFIGDSKEILDDKVVNILLFTLKEITMDLNLKIDAKFELNLMSQNQKSCSFADTYYVYTTGFSRTVAEERLVDEMEYREGPYNILNVNGCSKIGEPDTSCIWENHLCASTQAYCCD